MLSELLVRLMAAPFAVGTVLTFLFAARMRSQLDAAQVEFVTRRKPSAIVDRAWTIVGIVSPVLFLLPPLVPPILYANFLSFDFQYSEIVQIIGYATMIVGAFLLYASQRSLGRFLMREIGVTTTHELITTGPYAVIRHPLYSASLLLNLGLTLFYLNALPAVVSLLALVGAYGRARVEEELLASEMAFGQKYREYSSRTGMFLPKLQKIRPGTERDRQ